MFGCYRKGDANDPDTYVGAITYVLSAYPEDVIRDVTHPLKGLPSTNTFMPSVAELKKACDELMRPRLEYAVRQKQIAQQFKEREEWERKR